MLMSHAMMLSVALLYDSGSFAPPAGIERADDEPPVPPAHSSKLFLPMREPNTPA